MKRLRFSVKKMLGIAALWLGMVLLNFLLPFREPFSFPLFFASLSCGVHPLLMGAGYLAASAVRLSPAATLSAACQACFLTLIYAVYRKKSAKMRAERYLYALLAQLPFIFLFPGEGYGVNLSPLLQRTALSVAMLVLCFLFEGGLKALLFSAFRCRLQTPALAEIAAMWMIVGYGFCNAFGSQSYLVVSLFLLLAAVILLKNASAIPAALILSVPLCLKQWSIAPFVEYAVCSSCALFFEPYGRGAAAVGSFLAYTAFRLFDVAAPVDLVLSLLCGLVPAAVCICLPSKAYKKLSDTLLFYRERTLPRIAVNRNRRAVGEQLYEISALFREIEQAFIPVKSKDDAPEHVRNALFSSVCTNCEYNEICYRENVFPAIDKLIAVGVAKGNVNLIDLPSDLTAHCKNTAELLFVLNQHLAEYVRYTEQMQGAHAQRMLLAEQARGVSDILRDLALKQSEEITFSDRENAVYKALTAEGILCQELFLYGEEENFTVSVTASEDIQGKKLCDAIGKTLNMPLSLSEKIPLTSDRACFILRKKPRLDAAFGIASCPKEGEFASGDTHSILKIDERRFLVALSDGMGSGEAAREVSDNTLSLIESCYKAGMPSENVLSTVNKLIAYSSDERFSCLDIASVNLDTGTADIVKIGSPTGFVLTETQLNVLEGQSLPMGVLDAVHPTTLQMDLNENEFLIFMSDGVSSAFASPTELISYLNGLKPVNPQSLAEEILRKALGLYGGKAEDDMTVLTVRMMSA